MILFFYSWTQYFIDFIYKLFLKSWATNLVKNIEWSLWRNVATSTVKIIPVPSLMRIQTETAGHHPYALHWFGVFRKHRKDIDIVKWINFNLSYFYWFSTFNLILMEWTTTHLGGHMQKNQSNGLHWPVGCVFIYNLFGSQS